MLFMACCFQERRSPPLLLTRIHRIHHFEAGRLVEYTCMARHGLCVWYQKCAHTFLDDELAVHIWLPATAVPHTFSTD